MDQLQTRLDALEQQMCTVTRRLRWWRGLAAGLLGLAVLTWALPSGTAQEDAMATSEKEKKTLEQRVAALESLLKHFSRQGNDVTIKGANLHLVNGLGRTDCFDEQGEIPDCPNGLGNLIVGYNELRVPFEPGEEVENIRTGSHNVVVGQAHNFSSVGGLVVGAANTISGGGAAVSGGRFNTASGTFAAVSGGASIRPAGRSPPSAGGPRTRLAAAAPSSAGDFRTRPAAPLRPSAGGSTTRPAANSLRSAGEGATPGWAVDMAIRPAVSPPWSAAGPPTRPAVSPPWSAAG